jgi:hypothetical protein
MIMSAARACSSRFTPNSKSAAVGPLKLTLPITRFHKFYPLSVDLFPTTPLLTSADLYQLSRRQLLPGAPSRGRVFAILKDVRD